MYSIYHFCKSLILKRNNFLKIKKLENFPFEANQISCQNVGVFPDMAIRVNKNKTQFSGGELIELKDSDSYTVSSFNSTIPSGRKEIKKIIKGENSHIKKQMEAAGDDIYSLPIRDVFYLVRGKKKNHTKVCLVYGSFFETVTIDNLINQSFSQVLDESISEGNVQINGDTKKLILSIFSEQDNFSKVRDVAKASVKLRFRIMTEVKAEGNILNSEKYPEILDNTFNFILPCDSDTDQQKIEGAVKSIFRAKLFSEFKIFKIKHHFNGYFLVLQTPL